MVIGQHIFHWLKALLIPSLLVFMSCAAHAQTIVENEDVIQTVEAVLAQPVMGKAEYKLRYTNDQKFIHALLQDDLDAAADILEKPPHTLVYKNLYTSFFEIESSATNKLHESDAFQRLVASAKNGVWQEQHISNLLMANIYLKRGRALEGLQHANNSLSVIPNLSSKDVQNSRYNSYYLLQIAYTLDRNPRAALNAVKKLVDINEGQASPFGQFSIVYNLGVSYEYSSNYSTALKISKRL